MAWLTYADTKTYTQILIADLFGTANTQKQWRRPSVGEQVNPHHEVTSQSMKVYDSSTERSEKAKTMEVVKCTLATRGQGRGDD
jgi:hypothetical protein